MTYVTKRASCPRCPSTTEFYRTVEVEGATTEIVDQSLMTLHYEDCGTFSIVRRYTGVYCGKCRKPVNISLV